RAAALRASLAGMLGRRRAYRRSRKDPGVSMLLSVDRKSRMQARAGALEKIAPRRFNPEGTAWLPILHTRHGDWHFTALYSNTARAHQLGRTGDWVVIYYYDADHLEGQCTVVTETRGPLLGLRVVRGREAECRRHYRRGGRAAGSNSRRD
ncbi:MAG: DNA-binding protein, partial [Gammaproteobacteria bacterium]